MGRKVAIYCKYKGECKYKLKIKRKDFFIVRCLFEGKCSQQTLNRVKEGIIYEFKPIRILPVSKLQEIPERSN